MLHISPNFSPCFVETNKQMQKLALHAGDAFKETKVEGINWLNACQDFLATLGKIINDHGLSINLTPFQSAVHWRAEINKHETLIEAARSLKGGVEKLKVGEELWLPSNLMDSKVDQGMMLGFKRTSNKRFEILTINFGKGIESHHSILINGEKKFQSCLILKEVSGNRLCKEDFFENLIESICFTKMD